MAGRAWTRTREEREAGARAMTEAAKWEFSRWVVRTFMEDPVDWAKIDLTWRGVVGPWRMRRDLLGYVGTLERMMRREVAYIFAAEVGPSGGRLHAHALLDGVGGSRREVLWRIAFERIGRARVLPVESPGGAVAYVVKYVLKDGGPVKISPNLERWRTGSVRQEALPIREGGG
jgi:hypothetical protein